MWGDGHEHRPVQCSSMTHLNAVPGEPGTLNVDTVLPPLSVAPLGAALQTLGPPTPVPPMQLLERQAPRGEAWEAIPIRLGPSSTAHEIGGGRCRSHLSS